MGADFNIKPVGAPVATPSIKPAPEAAREALPTELPASMSVTVAESSLAAKLAPGHIPLDDSGRVSHDVIIDRAAAAIVYRVVDNKTSQVINQYPEASRLRARAYLRAQDEAKLEKRSLATDRRI
jgi:hypothetical protein